MNSLLKVLMVVVFIVAVAFMVAAASADGWGYHHVENGWYVYGPTGDYHDNNDGWWYRKSCDHLYHCGCQLSFKQIVKIGSYSSTGNSSSVTDKLSYSLVQLAENKGKAETLLVLNDAEQQRLRSLATSLGFYADQAATNGQYGGYNNSYNNQASHIQRGNTIYGFDYTYDGLKDPFEDLKIGAELTRLSIAAREHRESSDVMAKHLIESFNFAVDRYSQLKSQEMQMFGQSATFKMKGTMQPKEPQLEPEFEPEQAEQSEAADDGVPPIRNPKIFVRPGAAFLRLQRMQETIRRSCVTCHNGTPGSMNKTLNLKDVTTLTRQQFDNILARLITKDTKARMPRGGPYLNKDLIDDFYEYKKFAFTSGRSGDK